MTSAAQRTRAATTAHLMPARSCVLAPPAATRWVSAVACDTHESMCILFQGLEDVCAKFGVERSMMLIQGVSIQPYIMQAPAALPMMRARMTLLRLEALCASVHLVLKRAATRWVARMVPWFFARMYAVPCTCRLLAWPDEQYQSALALYRLYRSFRLAKCPETSL
eukprot:365477-Chlamydomonas_euryale.AAC.10